MRLHSLYVLLAVIADILMFQEGLSGTNAMTLQTFSGQPLNSAFGQSVAIVGDVNGDGYDDLAIGALYNGEGRVYIFFGGATVDTIPDVILNYRMSNDRFGECVARAGDVNGDGYADVIVGAQQSGPLGTDSGHVYIFFGGAVMDSVPDVIMAGLPGELFGRSVAGAGDVNGDGYPDVIVGANGSDAAGLDVGRAYIFFGGVTVDNIPDVIITGTLITENLGNSVAGAGDVNNDGYGDVIVGAYTYDVVGGNNSGRAYLYLGGSPMNNVADVVFSGLAVNFDYFGTCVAGAGDVNGDGYDDVLISAQENSTRGRTSLYLGGSVMNNVADVTFKGEAINNYFGNSAASAGDINGDGYADVIIGAFGNTSSTGKAYIYYGGASMDTIPDLTVIGEAASDRFGVSVAGLGDVNGDGFGDVIVGAKYGGATDIGRAYLYLSSGGPLPIQLVSFVATGVGPQRVRLDWTTLSELNNYGFEIQRKTSDQLQFDAVPNSFISGHGTTNESHSYSFIDSFVTSGRWSYRLKQMDFDGSIYYSEPVNISVLASVKENMVPKEYDLQQNYPNPFNPSTQIRFDLPEGGQMSLVVYDVLGRQVAELANGYHKAGNHSVTWNAAVQASGIYFARFNVTDAYGNSRYSKVNKLVLMK